MPPIINPTNTPPDTTRAPTFGPMPQHTVAIKKRKHDYSLLDKEDILREISTGEISTKHAMEKYGMKSASFVRDWKRGVERASINVKFAGLEGHAASKKAKTSHTGGKEQYPLQSAALMDYIQTYQGILILFNA
jgi:hypothetical protein